MRITIVGGGKLGESLARQLQAEGHAITVVDKDEGVIEQIGNTLDVIGYIGNGASYSVLKSAGAAESDLLIAVAETDEVNMLSCLVAHKLQPLGGKPVCFGAGAKLRKSLRSVYQEKVAPIAQRFCGGTEQLFRGAAVLAAGRGQLCSWPTGKIGRVGYAYIKTAVSKAAQVLAHALQAVVQLVCTDVIQSAAVCGLVDFKPGDGATVVGRAQKKSQCAAAASQI